MRQATRHLTRSALRWLPMSWLLVGGSLTACGVTDEDALPPYLDNPANVQTPAGALARYRGAFDSLPFAFAYVVRDGNAVVTDELAALPLPFGAATDYTPVDSRNDLSGTNNVRPDEVYRRLHALRAQARETRGLMTAYVPGGAPELRGHLYALEGYAELFLADVFCSGIPLSTVDFGADYTLAAGSTTEEVYAHARVLFDSALALTSDSLEFGYWATVGKGRALLALDSAAAAATAVAAVPTSFQYQAIAVPTSGHFDGGWFAPSVSTNGDILAVGPLGVGDREGVHGLDYRSSGDPRIPVDTLPSTGTQSTPRASRDPFNNLLYVPDTLRYPLTGVLLPSTFTLADGIEARLIEAEAALRVGGPWLATLNQLRSTVGLADTTDPGTPAAQVDLLFRERAFWLYLTSHRLGDLRRLVRQYGRNPDDVFPSNSYPGGTGQYGHQIVFPVPASERRFNPKYTGCIDFNA